MPRTRTYRRRRTRRVARPRRLIPQTNHVFKRICGFPTNNTGLSWLSGSNGSGVTVTSEGVVMGTGASGSTNFTYYTYSSYFTLDMLPGYTEFTALFAQYKILKLTLSFMPYQRITMATVAANGNQCVGAQHYSYLDYEDATVPAASLAGLNQVRQETGVKRKDYFRGFRRSVVPRLAIPVFSGGVFSDYTNAPADWIDSASPDVQHFGFKGLIQVFAPDSSANTNLWFRPEMTVVLALRRVQ